MNLDELELESVRLLHDIKLHVEPGPWEASPVEQKYLALREALLCVPGLLPKFRRSAISAGRLNFPDMPRPKEHYLEWDEGLHGQRFTGGISLFERVWRLRKHQRVDIAELHDKLVGTPTTYRFPKSFSALLRAVGRRLLGVKNPGNPEFSHITEAQIRFVYYRNQICSILRKPPEVIMEIGSGYGGLGAELLDHLPIRQYVLIDLPDAMPLAYFYLSAYFATGIQIVYRAEDRVDPNARIVILAPWKLRDLEGKVDLLINTMSFQHMTFESVNWYLAHADRLKTRYMYLVNRDHKRDPTDPIISEYNIPQCYRKIHDGQWLFGPTSEVAFERES